MQYHFELTVRSVRVRFVYLSVYKDTGKMYTINKKRQFRRFGRFLQFLAVHDRIISGYGLSGHFFQFRSSSG